MDLRSIIVATDFSANAQLAVERAASLADRWGLPLEVLHVVNTAGLARVRDWFRDRADLAERLAADAQQSLDAVAASLVSPGRQVGTRLVAGDVVREISAASAPDVLLVVGARGESTAADLFFGSTAERVVRESRGPMLVVRNGSQEAYRNVLVGVDLDEGCGSMLRDLAGFVPDARITAFHAYKVPFEGALRRAGVLPEEIERHRGDALQASLDGIAALGTKPGNVNVVAAAERGDAASLVVKHGARIGADLLAVARRSRSAFEAALVGSVARRVVAEADRDVLVLRGPAVQS